ncbi:MAG TPA: hypothetical protein VN929_08405 [Burkholderiales bacterium]|nr:hypothetical protein [Burkholderiales bacterium]
MGALQFTTSTSIDYALWVIAGFPFVLGALARLPGLKGRNAGQFAISTCLGTVLWIALIIRADASPHDVEIGLMLLASAYLMYLEIWALISRGYTLGVLVTLFTARRPLGVDEIAARYRRGDGLSWIMRHRMEGLIGTGLVASHGDTLALTPFLGVATARIYRFVLLALGLARTSR